MDDKLSHYDSQPLSQHIADVWLAMNAEAYAAKTIEDYREKWAPFYVALGRELGRRPLLADFQLEAARRYVIGRLHPDDGRRPLAPVSAAAHVRVLKAVATRLFDEGKTGTNRLAALREPKGEGEEKTALTAEEVIALLDASSGLTLGARRNAALIGLLVDAGPRISEVIAADVEDVDWAHGWIRILHPAKRGPKRNVPLGRESRRLLQAYLGKRRRGPLFLEGEEDRMTAPAARQVLARLSQRLGMPRVSPHDLRHTAATFYSRLVTDDAVAAKVFGWIPSGDYTKARYTHLEWEDVTAIHQKGSPLDHVVGLRRRRGAEDRWAA